MKDAMDRSARLPPETALRAVVHAAMVHQIERPALAHAVEHLSQHLSLGRETAVLTREMAASVQPLVTRIAPGAGPAETRDTVAIVKGLISAAMQNGDPGGPALAERATRAALGYLRQFCADAGNNSPSRANSVQFPGQSV